MDLNTLSQQHRNRRMTNNISLIQLNAKLKMNKNNEVYGLRRPATRKLRYRKDDGATRAIYGCPVNFRDSLTTPTATFP